jgi:excinuclease ABC subunit C
MLLRDDKSFPFIHLTADSDFPQLTKFRGARDKWAALISPVRIGRRGEPHAGDAAEGVSLRSCSDNIFNNRIWPCLLFQIKRCSAPVGCIGREDYALPMEQAHGFLS